MIQWLLVILILGLTIVYLGRRLFRAGQKSPPECEECSSDCSSCPFNPTDKTS